MQELFIVMIWSENEELNYKNRASDKIEGIFTSISTVEKYLTDSYSQIADDYTIEVYSTLRGKLTLDVESIKTYKVVE